SGIATMLGLGIAIEKITGTAVLDVGACQACGSQARIIAACPCVGACCAWQGMDELSIDGAKMPLNASTKFRRATGVGTSVMPSSVHASARSCPTNSLP